MSLRTWIPSVRRVCLLGTALGAICTTASPAIAQEAETSAADRNEIIVQARKRDESLQDVPLAVTALDQAAVENSFVSTIDDLEQFAPNVELSNIAFAAKSLAATIRGIGFADVEKSFEPAVGVSIDGVFLGSSGGAAIDVFDIEAVEILRGPQGTLYGRNTVGGVINVRRTRPTKEFGARAMVRIGNHGRQEYLAVANTGRVGDFALKGYYFKTLADTYATNTVTGEKERLSDNASFGGAVSYQSGSIDALVSVDRFVDDSGQPPVYNLSLPGATFCDLTLIPFVDLSVSQGAGCLDASFGVALSSDFEQFVRPLPVVNSTDGWAVTGNVDIELTDTLTLTSVTGWRDSDEELRTDNLGAPLVTLGPLAGPGAGATVPLFFATRNVTQEQFSQELRLSGEAGSSVDFVLGAFYLNSTYDLTGGPGPFGTGFGNAFAFGGVSNAADVSQDLTAWAIFGDATIALTDKLSVSVGTRYSDEDKDIAFDFIASSVPGVAGTQAASSASFDQLTGRVILQYDFTPDVMGFAGWSRGFRSGGFNGRAATPSAIGPYDPEIVDSFEGGFRTEFADGAVRINPTVFVTRYRDKQEEVSRAVGEGSTQIETVVQNAASAEIWGVELEALVRPTDNLSWRATFGYLNAEYDEFLIPDLSADDPATAPLIDVADLRQLRRAPDVTFSTGIQHELSLTDNLFLVSRVDYSFIDELASDLTRDTSGFDRDTIPAQDSFDFSLTLRSDNPGRFNWALTGYIRDAFDDNAGRLSTTLDVGAFYFGSGQVTKQYGVELLLEI